MSITRYLASVVAFIMVITLVLGVYWLWRDYGNGQEFTWESWRAHVDRRWEDFKKGHINLD